MSAGPQTDRARLAAAVARAEERKAAAERSLETVQRAIVTSIVMLVIGTIAPSLAIYLVVGGTMHGLHSRSDILGLWGMTGVIGLCAAGAVLVIYKKKPYSPWVLIGLLPMLVSAYWIFS